MIDGPQSITGVHRQVIGTKRISLTSILASKLPRNATQKSVKKAWAEQNLLAKWNETAWAKKLAAKEKRASLGDFERFKVMVAQKQKGTAIAAKINSV